MSFLRAVGGGDAAKRDKDTGFAQETSPEARANAVSYLIGLLSLGEKVKNNAQVELAADSGTSTVTVNFTKITGNDLTRAFSMASARGRPSPNQILKEHKLDGKVDGTKLHLKPAAGSDFESPDAIVQLLAGKAQEQVPGPPAH